MTNHRPFHRWPIVAFATSLISLALVFFLVPAYAQGTAPPAPLNDWRSLLTPDAILAIAFLITAPLTALIKHLVGTQDTATVVVNVIANALAKGFGLYLTGAASLAFAVVSIVLGVITDQAIYRLLVQTSTKGAGTVIDTPVTVKGGLQP